MRGREVSDHGQILLELAEQRVWAQLTPAERDRFDLWMREAMRGGHAGMSLALLLWEGHRRWRRRRSSSSQTLAAQSAEPEDK